MILEPRIGLSFDCRDAPECDRCILNLLDSLMQAKENNSQASQWQQIVIQFKQFFGKVGAIIVTEKGQVKFINQRSEQLLNQYFGVDKIHSLPDTLQHWLNHQIFLIASECNVQSIGFPLYIEKVENQLLIQPICQLIDGQYLLLLEEQKKQFFSIPSLELLGLTQRESAVLFWVAKDKSNAAIAKVLGCREGTVRKHLEHIHQKLGVQTRTAAVMVALERLGLLKGEFVAMSS